MKIYLCFILEEIRTSRVSASRLTQLGFCTAYRGFFVFEPIATNFLDTVLGSKVRTLVQLQGLFFVLNLNSCRVNKLYLDQVTSH